MNFRIGFGYDVHELKEGHELIIGSIAIPHSKGAVGHSDADVLIHAICDALLGAAALGDIGLHFPDTAPEYKNIDSTILLKNTVDLIHGKGYRIGNIDTSICLQAPRIAPYIPDMISSLSKVMEINVNNLSIKATTTEKLGFIGQEEGVAAYAVALLKYAE